MSYTPPPTRVKLPDIDTHERFVVIAHRGDPNSVDGYPESTIEGNLQAARRGANVIDLDCRRSSDGTWHLMHDATVDRTTDGTGNIADKTDAQIAALNIDGGLGYDNGRHGTSLDVPTLDDMLDALRPYNVTVQFDVKVEADAGEMAEYVVQNGWAQRAVIIVYTQAAAQAVKAVNRDLIVGGGDGLSVDETDIVGAEYDDYNEADVLAAAPKQFVVSISADDFGTANESEETLNAYLNGAWGIVANDIERAVLVRNSLVRSGFIGARVYNSGNLTAPQAATALTFDSERYDAGGLHSTSVEPTRLTAPVTGVYHIGGNVQWAGNATGQRALFIRLGGSTDIADSRWDAVTATSKHQHVSCDYYLTAGQYVELVTIQTSGGDRTINAAGNFSPEFWMHRLGGFA